MRKNTRNNPDKITATNANPKTTNPNAVSDDESNSNDNQRVNATKKLTTDKSRFSYDVLINAGYGKDLGLQTVSNLSLFKKIV